MAGDESERTQRRADESDVVSELRSEGFEVDDEAGRGGFGVVYRCRQPALDRVVAVKVLSADSDDPVDRVRFLREQQAMGRVSGHPNIVHVLQAGITEAGRPYIVMPFHRRDSLETWIGAHGALSVAEALAVGVKMSGALETAHRAGVLHRDVKPANILLTEYGEPQLTDFGIARIAGGDDTTRGLVLGSPAYTAPELLGGGAASTASDVYGLGATLFTALAGRSAFGRRRGEQLVAQLLRISTAPLPDLREKGLPDAVCDVIEMAMTRDPAARPPSAEALGQQLRGAADLIGVPVVDIPLPLTGEEDQAPVRATADSSADHTAEYVRRRELRPTSRNQPPRAPTKYRPPVTLHPMVARTRLLERLDAGGGRPRLVLIHGPAGYGKTTLAAQRTDVLRGGGYKVAWLSIDNDDNTLVWFLAHLVEAIALAQPDLGSELIRELEGHGEAVHRYVLTALINRLHTVDEHVTLVVDDWHRVTNEDTRAALAFLLEHGCHHLQLIVTSRTRLGLPLSAMRVRDELIELDAVALRFDREESGKLLVQHSGLELKDTEVAELEQTTDGWAAALQLVSLTLRERPDPRELIEHLSGSHREIGEYLAENVLNGLDSATIDFVLATAIPERISGALADALTGQRRGQAMLEEIEARDLFLRRLDDDARWFRYHPLFAEFLRRRLQRDDSARADDLHRRAAEWSAENGQISAAVDHYVEAGEEDSAITLVDGVALDLLEHARMATLLGLAEKLPAKGAADHASLQIMLAWAHSLLHHRSEAERALTLAHEDPGAANGGEDTEVSDRAVEAALIRATNAAFDDELEGVDAAVALGASRTDSLRPWVLCGTADLGSTSAIHRFDFPAARQWQEWARPYHQRSAGPFSVIYGYCLAGIAAREQLDLDAAERSYRHALALATDADGMLSYSGRLTGALLGELRYEQGHLTEAEKYLDRSYTLGAEGGIVDFMAATYGTGARVKAALGHRDVAAQRLDEGADLASRLNLARLAARIDNERVRCGIEVPSMSPTESGTGGGLDFPTEVNGIVQVTAEMREDSAIRSALRAGTSAANGDAVRRALMLAESIDGSARPRARLNADLLVCECLAVAGQIEDGVRQLVPVLDRCLAVGLNQWIRDAEPAISVLIASMRANPGQYGPRDIADTVLARLDRLGE
ncbi:protein kinase [Rhodococcus opacus]|uniref:serine/threonine-protein kinase n=1 Tax=Rhodococcus opacus TaxID=37919 RepID=UPI000EAA3714|nr:protein kinase [Rhodococcus opacus]